MPNELALKELQMVESLYSHPNLSRFISTHSYIVACHG
jgi:hypothetical protein